MLMEMSDGNLFTIRHDQQQRKILSKIESRKGFSRFFYITNICALCALTTSSYHRIFSTLGSPRTFCVRKQKEVKGPKPPTSLLSSCPSPLAPCPLPLIFRLQVPILPHRIKAWARFRRIQVMMTDNQCRWETLMHLFHQFTQRLHLLWCSGVRSLT